MGPSISAKMQPTPSLRQGCRTMLPRSACQLTVATALLLAISFPAWAQGGKSQPIEETTGLPAIPGASRHDSGQPCPGCNDCGRHSKPCLERLCDWIGYTPMRTGSTCGYPRTWKRRPDLYLYFRDPCRPASPAAAICEPCTRYVPVTGDSSPVLGSPLPQPSAIGSIKE